MNLRKIFDNQHAFWVSALILVVSGSISLIFFLFFTSLGSYGTIRNAELALNDQLRTHQLLSLKGEWAFSWQKFLTYSDINALTQPQLVDVPGTWNDVVQDGKHLPGFGYATYWLHVNQATPGQELTIRIDSASTAYSLYINDQKLASSGIISDSPLHFVPYNKAQMLSFTAPGDDFYIIMQIANFSYARGGFWLPVELGTPQAIQTLNDRIIYKDALLLGMLLILALYHLFAFLFFRNVKAGLYLLLLSISMMIRIAVYGDYVILRLWPNLSFDFLIRLNYLTLFWAPVLFYLILDDLLPGNPKWEKLRRIYLSYAILGTAITGLMSIRLLTSWVLIFDAMILLIVLSALLRAAVEKKSHNSDSYIIISFLIPATSFLIHDVLLQTNQITSRLGELTSIELVGFMFVLSVLTARRYTTLSVQQLFLAEQLHQSQQTEDDLSEQILILQSLRNDRLVNQNSQSLIAIIHSPNDPMTQNLKDLENQDHKIVWFNGSEIFQDFMAKNALFDLLILSNRLQSDQSYLLISKLREKYSLLELPILLLTERDNPQESVAGYWAGANDCLGYPFEPAELVAKIRHLIQVKNIFRKQIQTELSFLQAQIKPHFIFNALSVIASLSTSNPEKAKNLLLDLSDYLRDSFDFESTNERTTLKRELHLLSAYISIEVARFGDRLDFKLSMDQKLELCQVPMLCLQPLVENSIRHGLMVRSSGGWVQVKIQRVGDFISFTIEDNGVGISQEIIDSLNLAESEIKTGVGLRNIHRRLLAYYGRGLTIHSSPESGTIVQFEIPYFDSKVQYD